MVDVISPPIIGAARGRVFKSHSKLYIGVRKIKKVRMQKMQRGAERIIASVQELGMSYGLVGETETRTLKILAVANWGKYAYTTFKGSRAFYGFLVWARLLRQDRYRMLLLLENIKLIRILLAFLVMIASSGATVILHRCQMEEASCCSKIYTVKHDGCDQRIPAQPGHSVKPEITCHTNVLAGGLALKQALLEKGNRQESNVVVIPFAVAPSFPRLVRAASPSYSSFVAQTIHAPSVDRYILFDSFLI